MCENGKAAMSVSDVKELVGRIEERAIEIERATARRSGIRVSRERLKNLLFMRQEELVRILKDWVRLAEETETLRAAREESGIRTDEPGRKAKTKKGGQREDKTGKENDPGLVICTVQ